MELIEQFLSFIKNIFPSLLASGLLSAGMIWIVKNWLSERLKQSISHEYSVELKKLESQLKAENSRNIESLKSELHLDQAKQTMATQSYSEAHRIALEKQLEAANKIWFGIIYVSQNIPTMVSHIDILTRDEIRNIRDIQRSSVLLEALSHEKITPLMTSDEMQECLRARAIAGEYLYSLFYGYRALVGRIAQLLIFDKENKNIRVWFEDNATKSIISQLLSNEEMNNFEKLPATHVSYIRRAVELKAVKYIDEILSGEMSVARGLEQGQKIIDAVRNLDRTSDAT